MYKKIIILVIVGILSLVSFSSAATLAQKLSGTILLQVEQHGEAWYVNPADGLRYYMKDGSVAYQMMRNFGLGITDTDLAKIPSVSSTDEMKTASSICSTNSTANRLKGKILLQVQQHGEAWYVYPKTCRSIYMKDGSAAYEIMRFLGLGITDKDLSSIQLSSADSNNSNITDSTDRTFIDKEIGDLITLSTIKIKINSVSEDAWITGPSGTKMVSSINNKFIILNIDVTNITNSEITFTTDTLALVSTSKNIPYYPLSETGFINNYLNNRKLIPNKTETGVLVYEAPAISTDRIYNSTSYFFFIDKAGTKDTYSFLFSKGSLICSENPTWTLAECRKVANNEIWIGMDRLMVAQERGSEDIENKSNYGNGVQWQWCWWNEMPSCLYDNNDDGKIDSYN